MEMYDSMSMCTATFTIKLVSCFLNLLRSSIMPHLNIYKNPEHIKTIAVFPTELIYY